MSDTSNSDPCPQEDPPQPISFEEQLHSDSSKMAIIDQPVEILEQTSTLTPELVENYIPPHEPIDEDIPPTPPDEENGLMITSIINAKAPPQDFPPTSHKTGILEINLDTAMDAPVFSEPETLEAMSKLGLVPRDLVLFYSDVSGIPGDDATRAVVLMELDRRRKQHIQSIIEERNRIIQAKMNPDLAPPLIHHDEIPPPPKRRKKKKKKKKKVGKKGKKRITPHAKRLLQISKKAKTEQKILQKKADEMDKQIEIRRKAAQDEVDRKQREMQEKLAQQLRQVNRVKNKKAKEEALKNRKTMAKLDQAEKRKKQMLKEKANAIKQKAKERAERRKQVEKAAAKLQKEKMKKVNLDLKKADKATKRAAQAKIKKPGRNSKLERILPPPGCLRRKALPALSPDPNEEEDVPK